MHKNARYWIKYYQRLNNQTDGSWIEIFVFIDFFSTLTARVDILSVENIKGLSGKRVV